MNTNVEKIIDRAFDDGNISDLYICLGDYKSGTTLYEYEKHKDNNRKYFDLASLTKLLVGFDLFYELGIKPDSRLGSFLPELSQFQNLSDIFVFSLLRHESGLKPWKNFWMKQLDSKFNSYKERHEKILSLFLRYKEDDLLKDDSDYLYSDLNYILLGLVLERVSNRSLKEIVDKDDFFYIDQTCSNVEDFVSYGYCPVRKKQIQGFVHDENCYSFSGVSAHAGLFSTSSALKRELILFLNRHHQRCSNIQNNYPTRSGMQFQDAGKLIFNKVSLGHLGFVGNDIWFDPLSSKFFILLSNRVNKARLSPFMKDFRFNLYHELSKEI